MKSTNRIANASAAGQKHGALARAAVINAALTVRDTMANKVAPKAKTGAKVVSENVKSGAYTAADGVKAGFAYIAGFVRNVVEK